MKSKRPKHFLLLVLLALLLPQTALADNINETRHYLVTMAGLDQLRIEFPIYDEDDYDGFIDDGYIYVTPTGGSKQTLLRFYTHSKDMSDKTPTLWFWKDVDGAMVLSRDQDYEDVMVTTTTNQCEVPSVPGQEYFKVYITWTVPASLRGKEFTISWKIHKKGNGPAGPAGESTDDISIKSSTWFFPDIPELIEPTLMEPMLGYDASHAGQTMLIYTMATSGIERLAAHYTEVAGNQEVKRTMLLDKELTGFIYLDADKCYKDFTIEAQYTDIEKRLRTSYSDSIVIPTLHQPYGFSASVQPDGSAKLQWSCRNNQWNDLMPNDTWEIQRNTTGLLNAMGEWSSIGQVEFLNKDTLYTFIDNALINNYEGQPVYYRIRRASTAAWDWQTGTYAQTSLPFIMELTPLKTATAQQASWNDNGHEANITFDFGGPEIVSGVYNTPQTGQFFVLRDSTDWERYAERVNGGERILSAIMLADIDIGTSQTMVGSKSNPFMGVFHGNGHTLTVHYKNKTDTYIAPFRYGNDAAIFNLHVTGSIYTTNKYVGGLMASAGEGFRGCHFENCRVSVAITCDFKGDAFCGGLVAHAPAGGIDLYNCAFDGQFIGPKAYGFSGMIGYCEQTPTIVNCLFAPTRVDIDPLRTSCFNFCREKNPYPTATNNCYYLTNINSSDNVTLNGKEYLVLRNATDWNTFISKVMSANGNSDVNAIMANDFNVIYSVGYRSNIPYRGTFEGNGHTLGVSITSPDKEYIAPFSRTKDATIRNLNVVGQLTGGMHASGLVGSSEGSELRIENCHVTVNVNTTRTHAGGILGHGHKAKNYILNCLFDGSINAKTYNSGSYAGAILGWEDGGTSNVVENNLENASFYNINHTGMNYNARNSGSVYGGTNCWNTHDWKECNKVGTLNSKELVENLGTSSWQGFGTMAVPKQTKKEVEQGTFAIDIEPAALDTLLTPGEYKGKWQLAGNMPLPVQNVSKDKGHRHFFWDKNAKVLLTINKSVDGQVRYTERRDLTPEEIAAGMVKVELTTSCVDHSFHLTTEQGSSRLTPVDTLGIDVAKKEKGEAARYEFNNNVEVSDLQATTLQSEVSLTWTVDGVGDYFRIIRKDKATLKSDTLEHAYLMNTYIDKTPKPQHVYTYKVEGVNDCEGQHISSTTADGWCKPTGVVRGYLRLRDGTAIAGRKVTAEPQFDGGEARSDTTDASGFFEIDGLIYTGQGSYKITAERMGDEGGITDYTASFSEDSNVDAKALLVMDEYYLLSGYVMYEGTSVPVIGAEFERDGEIVHNGSGKPIITDTQGRFSISMPKGTHSVRVFKEGHVFLDKGFYLDEKGQSEVSWQKSRHDYVFWDQTRVTLQGRVVGGEVQGNKPLGKRASVNNLGDSLTIVMQLEGDNASWLVRDQLNASITERHQDYYFGAAKKDTCHMDTYRHRLVIKPNHETGEYNVPLLPVKYKVTEIYAEGYPTLFQAGKVGETLDLTDYVDKDTVTYSRIYRAAPTLDVSQFNIMGEGYMGIKSYTDHDITGKEVKIELWNDSTGYSFGHPVYMSNSPIIMMLSAVEKYYWNNNPKVSTPDIVQLPGGEVRIQNALIASDKTETIQLDSVGEAIYRFTPQNLTFTNEDDMALKTLTMTLLYDGTFYDVLPMAGEPIRGYVMAAKAKSQGRRAVAEGSAVLVDILRDPPGASSSAYIESGTKLNYTFSENMKLQLGAKLTFGRSSGGINQWTGVWAGQFSGEVTGGNTVQVKTKDNFTMSFILTYYNSWQYAYTLENSERISTSPAASNVGADADVYIGMMQSGIMEDGIAVRAIDEDTYKLLTTRAGGIYTINDIDFTVPQGTMKLLAQGEDSKGKKVYLVRDEVIAFRSEMTSTFVHSQKYIEKELIPELFNLRNTFILPMGTDPKTAREVAKQKGHAMFISKVPITSETFGLNDSYIKVSPDDTHFYSDSVAIINQRISTWVGFLATNEKEKLEATDLVKRYDVDGRSSITYSESYGTSLTESRYFQIPLAGTGIGNISFGPGMSTQVGGGGRTGTQREKAEGDDGTWVDMEFDVFGAGLYTKMTPVFSFDYNYNYGKNESHSKRVGFTLAPSLRSNLVVDVYRSRMNPDEINARVDSLKKMGISNSNAEDLFFQYTTDEYIRFVRNGGEKGKDYGVAGSLNGLCSYVEGMPAQYRSLVYRTRGGATCQPYEDERRTKFYVPGVVLDAKTIEIDRPRIWVEQASISNVPYDEPARFTIHFVNESEVPAQATGPFLIYLDPSSNPKGAKVFVDGHPMAGDGLSVRLNPNEVVTKTIEVYPSIDYDYDNLQLGIKDPSDLRRWWNCSISAHFVPVAGKVNISLPGDKWVVNTESQYDSNRQQYYMPVQIDGFDVNYRNFDHIELQYKLSTQGDKDWVNVCSYYNDSLLMAKATGECKLIEDDGKIMATFWGETDPIEQNYDLRAVNYCRHGNGFLTRSSNILSGVKDTRRPQLFGTPKPEDGILGIGDDILLRFSEPIAGNYLRGLNNFQILGQTNSSNISLSTDLRFNGEGLAKSMGSRNLGGKSFTVEMMIYPDRTEENMTLFSHGEDGQYLELGVTSGWRLSAVFADDVFVSEPIDFTGLRQIAFVIEADVNEKVTTISFFDGTHNLGTFKHNGLYVGTGTYTLGYNQHVNEKWPSHNYKGEMLEFRLWNRALSINEMNDYGQKRLTGYELGLMDNFPLNEGQGGYSYNRVPNGGDLSFYATAASWKVPDGIGMKLDGIRGFRIDPHKFSRSNYQDYTLMFWFRTTDENGTLLSNGKAQTEADAKNHFNFGVRGGNLVLRLGGRELATNTPVSNGGWHHAALTVSRSRNVGNLYVDHALKKAFAIDTLGGINGYYLAAGATYLSDDEVEQPISGHIDEICMYEMALTENILKATAAMTPTGEELGLMAYLNFGRNELQLNNQQYLMPTGISLKRYTDLTTGELTTQRDTLIAQEVVDRLADKSNYAPMRGLATLENIPYSFVADGKDLLINLDLPDYQIEKTNIMVTVKDVTDLNGNTMASPVTMDLYVYRNPLRWTVKQLNMSLAYGEEHTFEATVQNLSGRSKRFTLQGMPLWITASQYEGVIGALGEQVITFTVSPSINMGDFDETIYLVGEDEMSEPLPLNIKVRGEKPDWVVDDLLHKANNSMSIIGQVEIADNVAHDSEDLLAVFNSEHRLLGVAHVDSSETGANNEGLFYLNVYNTDLKPIDLFFEFFDASTGTIHKVMPATGELTFMKDTVIGTPSNPVIFFNNNTVVQTIPLKKGWNWVSFNVSPIESKVNKILNNATKWEDGDALEIEKANGERLLITYKTMADPDDSSTTYNLWDYGEREIELEPTLMYRFFAESDKLAYVTGFVADLVSITVNKGWNRIGYISDLNLPIGTALADYADKASVGDIIKSQSEFAVLTVDASGNKSWKGTLKYLRVGEGYMLKHNDDNAITFDYPNYLVSRYNGGNEAQRRAPIFENNSGISMTVVAMALGVDVLPGDRLTAYRDGEVCGISDADEEGLFYLNVGDTHHSLTVDPQLTFTIERDDELLGMTTRSAIRFTPDAAYGTPDTPTAINFVNTDNLDADGWYDLSGRKVNNEKLHRGVYIHNNQKVFIK